MTYCEFCEVISRKSNNYYDDPLMETQSYYVKPALGSLCSGHIIIISKKCVGSIAQTYQKNGEELDKILTTIKTFHKTYGSFSYFFEHGNSNTKEFRSSCIWHAHLHVIPNIIKAERWREDASIFYNYSDLFESELSKNDYLAMGCLNSRKAYAKRHSREESQFFRRTISSESNEKIEWNYLLAPHHKHIVETFNDFKNFKFL